MKKTRDQRWERREERKRNVAPKTEQEDPTLSLTSRNAGELF